MKSVRIGMGAGFAYDRIEPGIELLEKGNLDYLCFECLGERTVAFSMLEKLQNPELGYNELLEERFDKILDVYLKQGVTTKIISNMGAANPLSAAKKIIEMAQQKGLPKLKVAAVTGDEVLEQIDNYMDYECMETDNTLSAYQDDIVSANAYIGCTSIIDAIEEGADVIITGRAADPSLVLAPAVHELGWELDDWNKVGTGTIAGHLLECAGQITGGYFADPGVKPEVPEPWNLGFPFADIYEDGEIVLSKVEGSGGIINEMTVKEQLLYEIQDPSAYITPDCVADITNAQIEEIGKDQVRVKGIQGHPKTNKLKVNVGYHDCFIGEGEISYGGPNCINRAKLAGETVLKRLDIRGVEYSEIRVDYIGLSSLYKEKIGNSMTDGHNSEVRLRVAGRTKDRVNAKQIGDEVETLLCCGPAAGGGARRSVREVISLVSVLVDENDVSVQNTYLEV